MAKRSAFGATKRGANLNSPNKGNGVIGFQSTNPPWVGDGHDPGYICDSTQSGMIKGLRPKSTATADRDLSLNRAGRKG